MTLAVFTSNSSTVVNAIFTDRGPIAKPPLVLASGTSGTVVDPVTLSFPGHPVTTSMVGKYVTITGSASVNNGTFLITARVSSSQVRVTASLEVSDPNNGLLGWSIFDPRDGQIADDPTDVTVRINGTPVTPIAVYGLLGQIVLTSAPSHGDDVKVDYSWVRNPTVEIRALNSREFRLNSWNRDRGYDTDVSHHYRYNNVLITPSDYAPLDMQATLAQPLQRDLKYRAYERAYTPVLNDPNTLTLNTPTHRIAYPPLSRTISPVFVSYSATVLPENSPTPWTRIGTGTTTLASNMLTVTTSHPGPFPTGRLLYWSRPIDLTFEHVYAQAWRMFISDTPTTEGVFTGIAAGYSDESHAVVVGYLLDGGVAKVGFLLQGGGNDPSVISAWNAVAFDWTVVHSYRIFCDMNGVISLYVDGDVTPTLQIQGSQAPFLEELTAPFNEVEGAFWGSLSYESANTSVWENVLYDILPTDPLQTSPAVFVSYEATTTPETSQQPWTPIGYAGTETIIGV